MSGTNLKEADLSQARLIEVDLSEADLSGANLKEAILFRAKMGGATVTAELLDTVSSLEGAIMPDGTTFRE
jgi:uncharacterized protein YjbI with pentapeptide repeats